MTSTASTSPAAATTLDRPPELERTLLGHPRGLGLLFFVEMWERFSYYGMRALLVLYMVNALGWTDGKAANWYGTYTAMVYLTGLIGGYVADRYLGVRRSLVVGGVIIALGHFVLALQSMATFVLGLILVVIGTGFFKPQVSTMVGQLYPRGDHRRDAGFTIYYMGINLGAFIAPLVCGTLGQRVGWHYGFGAAGVGMVLGLALYLWGRDKYLPGIGTIRERHAEPVTTVASATTAEAKAGGAAPAIVGAVLGAAVAFAASGGAWRSGAAFLEWIVSGGGWLALLFGIIIGAALAITLLGTRGEERKRVTALFIVVFFVVFFWMAFEQAGSSMNLFADRHTELTVGNREIPSTWFQSVNSLFILAFALPFAAMWRALDRMNKEPSTALKMVLGLFLLGLGFLFLVWGGRGVDAGLKVSPFFLVAAYLFHTLGELCLSPVGLSYVTKVAPWRFASLLMGVWFLANAAANFVGGKLAALTEKIPSQAEFFMIPVYTSIGAAIVMLMLVPLLKRLTASVDA